jgi:hypothetical protein
VIAGFITTKHVFLLAPTIVAAFGLRAWGRCLLALATGKRTTFLALVYA